ncbi:MAG: hypothetical protein IKA87_06170 [Lentisphaeria bacterium]|nr:hypothetical protein [Lentisphaeria bacterium]
MESYINSLPGLKAVWTVPEPGIKTFLSRAAANGITVIGGLPAAFDDTEISEETLKKIEGCFTGSKALFIAAENRSGYPRKDFFDTGYHLKRKAQIRHSAIIADAMLKKYPSLFPNAAGSNK